MVFSDVQIGIPYGDGIYDWGIATDSADLPIFDRLPSDQLSLLSATGTDAIAMLGGDDTTVDDSGERIYFGNRGNDSMEGFAGSDTIASGRDNDTIDGGQGNDILFGNLGNDVLSGHADDDWGFGGQDDDWVLGNSGNDRLYGDRDRDTLYGGVGIDTLTGGPMSHEGDGLPDTFALDAGERDVITDFENGIDRIMLPNGVSTDEIEVRDDPEGGTLLISTQTGEPLAFLADTPTTAIDPEDFIETQSEGTIDLVRDLGLVDDPIPVGEGVWFLGSGIPPDELQIDRPNNVNAADTTNTIALQIPPLAIVNGETSLGLDLHGSGLTVGVWEATEPDTGSWRIQTSHQELTGRVPLVDSGTDFSNHATHVAGTIAASGSHANARGMADLLNIRSYSHDNDFTELDRDALWMVASNHSYGQTSGWTIGSRDTVNVGTINTTDVWLQDYSTSSTEDVDFGKYSSESRDLDEALFANPHLLSVWSAGNDRDDAFSNQSGNNTYVTYFGSNPSVTGFTWVGSGWYRVAIGVIAQPGLDGNGNTGYDSLAVF
ncbi:MAG: S8 family serine peptidase [Cyanobacteria bacterium SBC]|nr:S8 family serine peptidase [Cyanobacteria bacterium SBC]